MHTPFCSAKREMDSDAASAASAPYLRHTCIKAMATVSPKSICRAVEVTGARSKGQSSRSSGRCTDMSHMLPSLLGSRHATLTSFAPFACELTSAMSSC